MTIQNTTIRKAGPSQGNGVTTVFPFTFKVFTTADILVTYLDASGVESVLVLTTNYTVSLNADQNTSPGGSVTLLVAPATATYITLTSQLANTQTLALTNSGGFYPESINNALDRTVIEIQQLAEQASRAVTIPKSSTASPLLPGPAANNVLGWDSTASALVNYPILSSVVSGFIVSNTTLSVPSQFATINLALTYLATLRITQGAIVTIQVADGTYNLTSGINLNHPDGISIHLIGNTSNPALCKIVGTNPPTFNGISCTNGHSFGLLDGFTIDLTAKATLANNFSGIYANNGSTLICGTHIFVNNWYYGINSSYNSTIIADYATVTYAGDVGIWAFVGSYISANYATSNNCSDFVNGWGYGFQGEFGSTVLCTGASATGNNIAGIASLSNSTVRALSSTSSTNTGSGFLTREWGIIECGGATASNNSRYAIEIADGTGGIYGATGTGNTLGQTNKFCFWDTGTGSARMAASSGSLRLDTNGADSIYFNTSGGLQFAIDHNASSVNCFHLQGGSTGGSLSLTAQGSDTNIGAYVNSKGAGVVGLNSNGKTAFQAYNDNASNVNYIQANGGLTGVGVTLSAQGSDAVVDLKLSPKGAGGYVQINTGYSATTFAQTGYVSVKDNTGTVRRLMVG